MSVLPPSAQNLLTGKNRGGEGRRVKRIVYSHSRGGHGGDGVRLSYVRRHLNLPLYRWEMIGFRVS
jgi:hypothetical protein